MKVEGKTVKNLEKLTKAYLNALGQEVNNPKPLFNHCDLEKPLTIQQQIQRVLRQEVSKQAVEQGQESFEEANDFDVEEEFEMDEPFSQYELVEEEFPVMKPESPSEQQQTEQETVGSEDHSPPLTQSWGGGMHRLTPKRKMAQVRLTSQNLFPKNFFPLYNRNVRVYIT